MKYKTCLLIFLIVMVMPARSDAKNLLDDLLQREIREYRQDRWCYDHGGQARTVLEDQTRIECLTGTHAIKFGVGTDWADALGKALYYGLKSGKKPGVVLILKNEEDNEYWLKLNATIEYFKLPVETWKLVR
jgi:hypothetical protein